MARSVPLFGGHTSRLVARHSPSTMEILDMGATANFDNAGSTPMHTDDASFGRTGASSSTSIPASGSGLADVGSSGQSGTESTKDKLSAGMGKAQDMVGQLQSKASDMATRLVNNVDVDDLTQKLEQQVRDNPARTLLIAAGVGYLLGRSMK